MITHYIDDTDVDIDNRDLGTTELTYKDRPGVEYSISIPFALQLVENAIRNCHSKKTLGLYSFEQALDKLTTLLHEEATHTRD